MPMTRGLAAMLLALAIGAAPAIAQQTLTFSRVVDLSHVIAPDMPIWPGDPAVEFDAVATFEKEGYFLRRFAMGEHSGTHMNAPNSFHADGRAIDAYDTTRLVLPAVVIDVTSEAAADPDYQLDQVRVLAWEGEHGRIPAGSLVLLYTGWQEKWDDPAAFFNEDAEGGLHFPGFAGAATLWLLAERGIAGVGIDTHGVDPGMDTNYVTNTEVLRGNGVVLECLANLDALPATGATLVIGLPRLRDGSGAPVAVTAFAP